MLYRIGELLSALRQEIPPIPLLIEPFTEMMRIGSCPRNIHYPPRNSYSMSSFIEVKRLFVKHDLTEVNINCDIVAYLELSLPALVLLELSRAPPFLVAFSLPLLASVPLSTAVVALVFLLDTSSTEKSQSRAESLSTETWVLLCLKELPRVLQMEFPQMCD